MTKKIYCIRVNYNSTKLINKLISNYPFFSFVVVDNSVYFILKYNNIDARILDPKLNIGYLGDLFWNKKS